MSRVHRLLKISHHAHSGKVRSHEHTSYLALGIILVLASVPLGIMTVSALSPGPQAGSVGLSGSVPATPPKKAATIISPTMNAHFSTSPVTIRGGCTSGLLVELYKNDIFAGSVQCAQSGTYSLDIDPMIGQNKIVAKIYDALNQAGPDSEALTIYYDVLGGQSAAEQSIYLGNAQLILNTNAVFRGSFPDQSFDVPIDILGGTPPYALNVSWGDSANNVVSRSTNATFAVAHAYKKAGTYQITIQATDAKQRIAFLTVASIINGQPSTAAAALQSSSSDNEPGNDLIKTLLVLWPLYTGSFVMVVSFWLGERREKHVLAKHGLLLST